MATVPRPQAVPSLRPSLPTMKVLSANILSLLCAAAMPVVSNSDKCASLEQRELMERTDAIGIGGGDLVGTVTGLAGDLLDGGL
ncbi:hypothetical protein AX15_000715 [Amanita polypyramis BW_CC]|nr:hypothetical protein AX15_000715 [Amanita polypyramis BW_CC]